MTKRLPEILGIMQGQESYNCEKLGHFAKDCQFKKMVPETRIKIDKIISPTTTTISKIIISAIIDNNIKMNELIRIS